MVEGLTGARAQRRGHRRLAAILAAILSVLLIASPFHRAGALPANPAGSSPTGDKTSIGVSRHQENDVRGSVPAPSDVTATAEAAAEFSFTFDSPDYPWTSEELAQLQTWTAPGSAPLTVLGQVAG